MLVGLHLHCMLFFAWILVEEGWSKVMTQIEQCLRWIACSDCSVTRHTSPPQASQPRPSNCSKPEIAAPQYVLMPSQDNVRKRREHGRRHATMVICIVGTIWRSVSPPIMMIVHGYSGFHWFQSGWKFSPPFCLGREKTFPINAPANVSFICPRY